MAENMNFRVGAFGDNIAITPHLDHLARISIRSSKHLPPLASSPQSRRTYSWSSSNMFWR
jgi:hypothetical protein